MDISDKSVLVIGAGAIGGFAVEELARLGVKKIYVVDGTEFTLSDLPRDIQATYSSIGTGKAVAAGERVRAISDSEVITVNEFFSKDTSGLISCVDIVLECVSDLSQRALIASECLRRGVDFVHAAVEGEKGELFLSTPDSEKFLILMEVARPETEEPTVYSAGTIASMQVALAVKYLTGNDEKYRNRLITVELDEFAVTLIEV